MSDEQVNFENVGEAVRVYVDMRDALRIHQKEAKEKEEEIKDFLSKISMWLRDKADELGVDSFKTPFGTAYRNTKRKYRIEDWDEFIGWVMESGNTHLLEKRVAQRAAREYEEAESCVPSGLETLDEVEFNVLRPTKGRG